MKIILYATKKDVHDIYRNYKTFKSFVKLWAKVSMMTGLHVYMKLDDNGLNLRIEDEQESKTEKVENKDPKMFADWIEDGYFDIPCVCSNCGMEGQFDWEECPQCHRKMKNAIHK